MDSKAPGNPCERTWPPPPGLTLPCAPASPSGAPGALGEFLGVLGYVAVSAAIGYGAFALALAALWPHSP